MCLMVVWEMCQIGMPFQNLSYFRFFRFLCIGFKL